VFKDAEIEWAVDPAKAKSLLRKLNGVNRPTWWDGKTRRGYVFYKAELDDLIERHPIPREAEAIRAEAKALGPLGGPGDAELERFPRP
jgi:hypothetical protein